VRYSELPPEVKPSTTLSSIVFNSGATKQCVEKESTMSSQPVPVSRAVVQIDHHHAQVLRFDAEHAQAQHIKANEHFTRQHGSEVRTEHEFFADVCDALAGLTDVLVVGSHTAQADFRHYVEKHRAALSKLIVGWQTVDHPTDGQLLALAREYFIQHEGMARTRTRM
jgi:hypothetical protein